MAVLKNKASLTFTSNSVTKTKTSNVAEIDFEEPLSVSAGTLETTYQLNEAIDFVYVIENKGTADLTNVTVEDNLGEFTLAGTTRKLVPLDYVDGSGIYFIKNTYKKITPADGSVIFTIPEIKKGETATLFYKTAPNEFAPLTSITTKAEVTADGLATPIAKSITVTLGNFADISIHKTMEPTTIYDNGTITYTFKVTNTGNNSATSVKLTDEFELLPTIDSVTVDGNAATEIDDNYTYDATTGIFELSSYGVAKTALTLAAATLSTDAATGKVQITPTTLTIVVKATF